jgi:hypothetical protein
MRDLGLTALNDTMSTLASKYKSVRSMTRSIAAGLSAEDQMVQSCPEAIPIKCHQAHTTWFFETFGRCQGSFNRLLGEIQQDLFLSRLTIGEADCLLKVFS